MKKIILTLVLGLSLFAGSTYETLVFVSDDLKSLTRYKSMRYDSGGIKQFLLGENFDKNSITYIKPNRYEWTKYKHNGMNQDTLYFPNTTNYAYLQNEMVNISKTKEGEYFLQVDGGACIGKGCINDENIISIILPKRFKIITAESFENTIGELKYNKNPDFKLIENTLTSYSKNVKGASTKIWFIDNSENASIYKNVSDSLEKYSQISVVKTDTQTKITMPMDNVFSSGNAVMKKQGKEWLSVLFNAIKDKKYLEIRVEGHSDNIPIHNNKYASNWELSAARASDAVKFLIKEGVINNKLAAVGYSSTRPLVKNSSSKNRAKNRRIEITIVGEKAN